MVENFAYEKNDGRGYAMAINHSHWLKNYGYDKASHDVWVEKPNISTSTNVVVFNLFFVEQGQVDAPLFSYGILMQFVEVNLFVMRSNNSHCFRPMIFMITISYERR